MTTEYLQATEEAEIQALVNDRLVAIRLKNVNQLLFGYIPGILSFDVVGPLQYSGTEAIKMRMEEWFSTFKGNIGLEISDLHITAGKDVAFQYCLNHVSATKITGEMLDMWWRETIGYQKIDGNWVITHQHSSVPFDVNSGQASIHLQP